MADGDLTVAAARARAQRAARLAVRPGRVARTFVSRPKVACCVAALVPLLALGVVLASRAFSIADPGYRDYLIRGSERVRVDDAREAARDEVELDDPLGFVANGTGTGADTPEVERSDNRNDLTLSFLFRAPGPGGVDDVVDKFEDADKGTNVLTREFVAEMKRIEDLVEADPKYSNFCFYDKDARDCEGNVPRCALRGSITTHPLLYGDVDEDGNVCGVKPGSDPVSAEQFTKFLDALSVDARKGNGIRAIDDKYRFYVGLDANRTEVPSTFITQTAFSFGMPFPGYKASDEDRGKQRAEYTDWLTGVVPEWEKESRSGPTELNVLIVGAAYSNALFGDIASRDLSFAIAAIILVLLFMWLHTSSLFLASAAMLQVVLAFPLAYFVYRFILQIKYFSSLQIMCIFLILGIAADDAFVFVDAWKQSAVVLGADCDLERRISWTYRRAVKAMAVTSFTTALAFGFTAVSPVMPVGTLGFWAALLVICQYLLVITMYPCAVIIWHRSLRPRSIRNCFKAPAEAPRLITQEDDDKAVDVDADGVDLSTPAALAKTAVGDLEDATSIVACDVEAAIDKKTELTDDTAGVSSAHETKPKKWWKSLFGPKSDNEYRFVERFFKDKWSFWIRKLRYAFIGVAVVLYGVSIYFATRLEPLSKTEAYLEEDHPIEVALSLTKTAFPRDGTQDKIRVDVFWGVEDIDRTGTSRYDPESIGTAKFDKTFDLKPAANQQFLLDACATIEANKELVARFEDDVADCWIRDFRDWRAFNKSASEFESYESDAALVNELRAFMGYVNTTTGSRPFLYVAEKEMVGFSPDGESVVYTELRFDTDVNTEDPHRITWPFYEKWQEQVDALAANAPEGVNKPLVTGGYAFMWAVTTQTLIRSAFVGIGSMLTVAAIVLAVSTANFVVASFATLTIGGIVCNLLALLFLWGYEMGLTESVAVIIAAGVSFDFCSHIVNAYTESPHADRFNRTRDALTELGISVLAGGLSTILAAAVLFFATITFFQKFARSLVSTVALSLLWSLCLLPALLMAAGPENEFGSLQPLFGKCLRCVRPRKKLEGSGTGEGEASS